MQVKRNSSIELLRIMAMLLIMHYHYIVHGGISLGLDNTEANAFIAKMMCMGGKIGVNIFIMISSYYFAGNDNNYKYIFSKIKKLYIPIWQYSVLIYISITILKPENFTLKNTITAIFPVISVTNWYATSYILFLLEIPILNIIFDKLSKKEYKTLCLFSFGYWSVLQTIMGNTIIMALNPATNLVWFTICFLIIAYIKKYKIKPVKSYIWIICIVICYAFFAFSIYMADVHNIFLCVNKATTSVYMMQINYTPVIICSFALFFIFKEINFSSKLIDMISKLTFGVYLIHDNDYVNNLIWERACNSSFHFKNSYFYLHALSGIMIVFAACCLFELIRDYITKKFIKLINKIHAL